MHKKTVEQDRDAKNTYKHRTQKHHTTNMNWFGKKKTSNTPSAVSATSKNRTNGGGGGSNHNGGAITETANTVVNLRENIATQEKREKHLEKKIEQLTGEAKAKMAKKDKKGEFLLIIFVDLFEAVCLLLFGRRCVEISCTGDANM